MLKIILSNTGAMAFIGLLLSMQNVYGANADVLIQLSVKHSHVLIISRSLFPHRIYYPRFLQGMFSNPQVMMICFTVPDAPEYIVCTFWPVSFIVCTVPSEVPQKTVPLCTATPHGPTSLGRLTISLTSRPFSSLDKILSSE